MLQIIDKPIVCCEVKKKLRSFVILTKFFNFMSFVLTPKMSCIFGYKTKHFISNNKGFKRKTVLNWGLESRIRDLKNGNLKSRARKQDHTESVTDI